MNSANKNAFISAGWSNFQPALFFIEKFLNIVTKSNYTYGNETSEN
jgi:hypothetical protein